MSEIRSNRQFCRPVGGLETVNQIFASEDKKYCLDAARVGDMVVCSFHPIDSNAKECKLKVNPLGELVIKDKR